MQLSIDKRYKRQTKKIRRKQHIVTLIGLLRKECNMRFSNSSEASKELQDAFNGWSTGTPTFGRQMAYAIIAANWAVHSGVDGFNSLLSNHWAKCSLALTIGYLGVNLVMVWLMTILHRQRVDYCDSDRDRWDREYTTFTTNMNPSAWPYTTTIELLGQTYRTINLLAPLCAGVLFVISLYSSSNSQ